VFELFPYQYDPTPLMVGNIDASIDFCDDVPYTIEHGGKQPNFFLLYDAGFTIGNDYVVTTEETIAKKRGALGPVLAREPEGLGREFRQRRDVSPEICGYLVQRHWAHAGE
jgi:hypothetical protein